MTALLTIKYTVYGDVNLDGLATLADLDILLADYNQPGTWSQGDFNYDGMVNAADLAALLTNYDKTSGLTVRSNATLDPAAIGLLAGAGINLVSTPEPGTIAMLAAGLVGLLAYAWRKRK